MLKLFASPGTTMPSVISDPFVKKHIVDVSVHAWKSHFAPYDWHFSGKVEFQNGDTKGEQRFNGDTFDDVVLKIKAMIESI